MPRKKTTDGPDPGLVYVAWQSGSVEVDGVPYNFRTGERLRGDQPAVQGAPRCFVPDGTPEHERPSAIGLHIERREAARPPDDFEISLPGGVPQALEREDTIQLTRAVTVRAGRSGNREIVSFQKGDVFNARSDLAQALPDDAYEATPDNQFTRPRARRRR
jgi:hypothetical protein